jgi:predicted alpha/beta superfamily hydrolase
VLYFFDADLNSFFQTFSGMIKQMGADASPLIPEMIVVGIVSQQRGRDSSPTHSQIMFGGKESKEKNNTGGASNFLKFIKSELIPYVDSTYDTSDYRIITGYSFTGLPVIQSLYTMPEVFNGYISIDPSLWWDDKFMLRQYENFLKGDDLNERRLFISTAKKEQKVYPKANDVLAFIEKLKNKPKNGLSLGNVIFDSSENHHTMPILSFYKGLRYIFKDYMIDNEARFRSATELKSHFESVSDRLGSAFHLREDLVDYFGYDRLYNDQFTVDVNRAIEFFTLNTEVYPLSANAWASLGEGYLVKGNKKKALEAFRKSLELNTNDETLKNKIKQLQNN